VRKKWPLPESTTRNPGFWPHTPRTAALILAISAGKVHEALWAYAAVFGLVVKQATMVAFVGIFQLMGIVFIALVPLVLIMRRPARGGAVASGH
jgi:hypothetical protein